MHGRFTSPGVVMDDDRCKLDSLVELRRQGRGDWFLMVIWLMMNRMDK